MLARHDCSAVLRLVRQFFALRPLVLPIRYWLPRYAEPEGQAASAGETDEIR